MSFERSDLSLLVFADASYCPLSVFYIVRALGAWWRGVFFSPVTVFADFTNTAGSVVIVPFVFAFLLLSVVVFYVGSWVVSRSLLLGVDRGRVMS